MDDDHELYEIHLRPDLHQPALIMAPDGWIDAGLAGAGALAAIVNAVPTELAATFDSDELIDYRVRRPVLTMEDGVYRNLEWPRIELRFGRDELGQDVLLLVGPEPDSRWRAFAGAVTELAGIFGVRMLVGLGGFPAPVPHTRTPPLAASASSAELANSIGVVPGVLKVPAGVLAAVGDALAAVGTPSIGIWARVPHYAAGMPFPDASLQLLDGLARLTGLRVDTPELKEAADATRRRLDDLASNSPQHRNLIRQLENQFDAESAGDSPIAGGWSNLPTGDELAAELEKFLRDESP